MNNKKIPYLCGGTFFFLLIQAKKSRTTVRERVKGKSDGLNDSAMMESLIQAINGKSTNAYGNSLKKNTSEFRECRINGSVHIPFNDPVTASTYDKDIKTNYDALLIRMTNFTEKFIGQEKASWLGTALIDLIESDKTIPDSTLFYVCQDGTTLSKVELHKSESLELQPLLIGIIHFILLNRTDNKSGHETLETWGVKSDHSERKLLPEFSLGKSVKTEILWHTYEKQGDNNHGEPPLGKNKKSQKDDTTVKADCNMSQKFKDNFRADFYDTFKAESDDILKYCIEMDPTAEPISLNLTDEIDCLIRKWSYDIRKISEPNNRELVKEILKTLSEYTYYVSDKFMRVTNDGGRLIFRNSSIEEGDRLCNIQRPNTIRLRRKLADLYKKLWPAPDLDEEFDKNEPLAEHDSNINKTEKNPVTIIQQQTNVVQNGEKNTSLVVNGTLNLEL